MKILVTGAAGFVGSRLSEVLLEGGHVVMGLDLFDQEDPEGWQEARLSEARKHSKFSLVKGDVTDIDLLKRLIVEARPKAVIHLASHKDLDWAEDNPEACMRLHTEGALAVMNCCAGLNIPAAVFGSSSHVYGGSRDFPFTEEDPVNRPLSILGAAMRAAELAIYAISLRSPVNTTVVRIFSAYGPRQSPKKLLPALSAAAEGRRPMPLFGDGTAGRDMIHIDDVVVGILRVLDRPAPFRVLNLGSGDSTTLGQVAELVAWLFGITLNKRKLTLRPGEMPQTFASIHEARESVGYNPSVQLEDGVRRYVEWFRERPEVFRQTIMGEKVQE